MNNILLIHSHPYSNQNLNYEKIYVFRIANVKLVFELCKYICDKILYLTYF